MFRSLFARFSRPKEPSDQETAKILIALFRQQQISSERLRYRDAVAAVAKALKNGVDPGESAKRNVCEAYRALLLLGRGNLAKMNDEAMALADVAQACVIVHWNKNTICLLWRRFGEDSREEFLESFFPIPSAEELTTRK